MMEGNLEHLDLLRGVSAGKSRSFEPNVESVINLSVPIQIIVIL